ncbi:MAG: F0F1 ATP synthase subunit A [Candidatus Rokubacteria bacterium]|nr:F0F1 ATP synthase subunit A [Candidatus Rokubacteria bacterium]
MQHVIDHPPILRLPGIPDHVLYTWLVMAILVVVALVAVRRLETVPRGTQNVLEMLLEQFVRMLDETIGPEGRRYLPLVATLGLFILTSNLLGLVPGMAGPTANLNTTAACALVVFFTYHWIGIRKQGLVPYLKHFAGPVPGWLKPLMFVIEIISHLARPLSLSLRLFGNMAGGHILVAIFFFMMGMDGLLGWALKGSLGGVALGAPGTLLLMLFVVGFLLPLKILVALVQTLVFCMLTMIYIAGALEEAGHEDGGHAHTAPPHPEAAHH